eukprot:1513169-Pyramimonas_sp.AAC.1
MTRLTRSRASAAQCLSCSRRRGAPAGGRGTREKTWGQSRARERAQEWRPCRPCPVQLACRRAGLPR